VLFAVVLTEAEAVEFPALSMYPDWFTEAV
jgi:hypothetical protein